ncbi:MULTISPECIES: NADPH-dependent FMN reductase [unclassified Cellulophaga]|uniref:NADPH-dependent FMN reductase n=1 Tax=unclassified Cellulophaga TaxID=2634405 RepID=UPI0026E3C2D6|nr:MULTISPECIES: NADPH-dependent FMN reductase [unclassified Cellulophaga]MDO6491046.1 NADPH-dependent FMN reductase [Cellulophaga sp. 2_MG-2023]MDO6493760.1 NADPH-dependent FMN reductase [Cellulophaga sp. 3_MG-2023]
MSTILAFAGSNSSTSINHKLATFTAGILGNNDVTVLDMAKVTISMYSEDAEKNNGFSSELKEINDAIAKADALVISVNEHNSGLSSFFKNLIDWLSRLDRNFLEGKKVLLLATSPGKRGALSALKQAEGVLPRFGAEIVATFALPSFNDNFKDGILIESDVKTEYQAAVNQFLEKL